jgi:tripartite-type tricarboxylate transporter receptor subunit TctC
MKKILLLLLISLSVHAEPIEMVVSGSPGIGDDYTSRKIAEKLTDLGKLEIIVLNKPGAAKAIGYNYVIESKKPTLLVSADTILDHKVKDVVEPLFFIGDSSNLVLTSSTSKINSIGDLIELNRKREIRVGHGGENTNGHKAGILLCEKMKLNCLMVPYKSGPEVLIGILSNTVDFFAMVSYGSESYLHNDKFKPLLVMTTKKHKIFDGVPILSKKDKDIETKKWTILFGKNLSESDKNTIHEVLKNLSKDFYTMDMGFWYEYKDAMKAYNDKP